MVPGGVTETIWHFAGYLHLMDELARSREFYNGSYRASPQEDLVAGRTTLSIKSDMDEFATGRTFVATSGTNYGTLEPLKTLKASALPTVTAPSFEIPAASKTVLQAQVSDFGFPIQFPIRIVVQPDREITVTYDVGDGEKLMNLEQVNWIADNDKLIIVPDSGAETLHTIDIRETLHSMFEAAAAEAVTPEEFEALPPEALSDNALADFIKARDDARATADSESEGAPAGDQDGQAAAPDHDESSASMVAASEASDAPILNNTVYKNETPQPAGTAHSDIEPPEKPFEAPQSDGTVAGVVAVDGSNTAANVAAIFDANEAPFTMVVLGDYFETNAIVQVNVYQDSDQVALTGPTPDGLDDLGGENRADNIAEFVRKSLFDTMPTGPFFAGLSWKIDVIEGDFLDVKTLIQTNWISDNDVTVQKSSGAYTTAVAGGNQEINLGSIFDLEIYDAIFIGGDYHDANIIYQKNFLIDDDILKIAATLEAQGREGFAQSVTWNGNVIVNDAIIANVGVEDTKPLTDNVSDAVDAIKNGETTLEATLGVGFPADASRTFNVLFITGDYYDINLISQSNVVSDVDTAIQLLPDVHAPRSYGDPAHDKLEQSVSTGGNTLTNAAEITDVGPTIDFYLAGDHYTDTILIQANIVVDDADSKVVVHDTETLVAEVIAFTGDPEPEAGADEPQSAPTAVQDPAIYNDSLSQMLH